MLLYIIPVANVSAKIGDNWITLTRGSNNQWAYYNSAGPWEDNFPMGLRITSVSGEVVEDAVPSKTGGDGNVQFKDVSCPFCRVAMCCFFTLCHAETASTMHICLTFCNR